MTKKKLTRISGVGREDCDDVPAVVTPGEAVADETVGMKRGYKAWISQVLDKCKQSCIDEGVDIFEENRKKEEMKVLLRTTEKILDLILEQAEERIMSRRGYFADVMQANAFLETYQEIIDYFRGNLNDDVELVRLMNAYLLRVIDTYAAGFELLSQQEYRIVREHSGDPEQARAALKDVFLKLLPSSKTKGLH